MSPPMSVLEFPAEKDISPPCCIFAPTLILTPPADSTLDPVCICKPPDDPDAIADPVTISIAPLPSAPAPLANKILPPTTEELSPALISTLPEVNTASPEAIRTAPLWLPEEEPVLIDISPLFAPAFAVAKVIDPDNPSAARASPVFITIEPAPSVPVDAPAIPPLMIWTEPLLPEAESPA